MSKKPNQKIDRKIKNSNLIPTVFQTVPNKKMLKSTLDVATSKGQLLNFDQTFGLRSAASPESSFFIEEADPVRRESQTNLSFVVNNDLAEYQGKTAYLDIENYFNIQNLPLKDPNRLDQDIVNLDLPINPLMLTEYHQYYWVSNDLPIIELTFNSISGAAKFSIEDSVIGKPYATLVDDVHQKPLELAEGMRLVFLGLVEEQYLTTDFDNAKIFYVTGVGTAIDLIDITNYDRRSRLSNAVQIPWENSDVESPYQLQGWGGVDGVDSWDAVTYTSLDPEYVVMERYAADENPWSVVNKWYHIGLIKTVSRFLDRDITTIANIENQAKRPIIQYLRDIEIANWPTATIEEIQGYFVGVKSSYENEIDPVDNNDYSVQDGDLVVFSNDAKIYQIGNVSIGATFVEVNQAAPNQGVMFAPSQSSLATRSNVRNFERLIYKNGNWIFAQNKITKNQTVYFEFYTLDGQSLSSAVEGLNVVTDASTDIAWDMALWDGDRELWDFSDPFSLNQGGVILDYMAGLTYDSVLERDISVSNIDFDVVSELNPRIVNSNQIKYRTDIDRQLSYYDNNGEIQTISSPYQYKIKYKRTAPAQLVNFWNPRSGLDITSDLQTLTYSKETETTWTEQIAPLANKFDEIHVFNENDELKLYFKLADRGYVKFTSKNSHNPVEQFLPLITSADNTEFRIVCHGLTNPITFYKTQLNSTGSATVLVELDEPYCENNGISNGVIKLNLSDTIEVDGVNIPNEISEDLTKLVWKYNDTYRSAIVRPEYKWRFLFAVYYQDRTYPVYHDYDFSVTDTINLDGSINYNKSFNGTVTLNAKADTGDKIIIESIIDSATEKTAPTSLTKNPLNENLFNLNYYSLYQNETVAYSHGPYIKEIIDTTNLDNDKENEIVFKLDNGIIVKHNNPLSKFAVMTTNMPFEFTSLLTKQGKHYDLFMGKFKSELETVIKKYDKSQYTSQELINMALEKIYLNTSDTSGFWYHSNMIGWGTEIGASVEQEFVVGSTLTVPLISGLTPISFTAGKETVLHIEYDGKILLRNFDYHLVSNIDGYYTDIEFDAKFLGLTVTVRQWNSSFQSRIPASLSKIGLAPVYQPQIYFDQTIVIEQDGAIYDGGAYDSIMTPGLDGGAYDSVMDSNDTVDAGYFLAYGAPFIIRHDGTRYYLTAGTDAYIDLNNIEVFYPVDEVDQLLYEYEKAVWSSIAYDVEHNSFAEYWQNMPGGFRRNRTQWNDARNIVNGDIINWQNENNLFILNNTYVQGNPFTYRYDMGSGDENDSFGGSWRAIYRYFYDTDKPHTHPWEMLGYTIKPEWWDQYYSWTDPVKRQALIRALQIGNRFEPPLEVADPAFARISDVENPEMLPVNTDGNLLAPLDLPWLAPFLSTEETAWQADWAPGDLSPYDLVYLSTQRGVASEIKLLYLLNPTRYVTNNWIPGNVIVTPQGKLDKQTKTWITPNINHDYHRKTVSGVTAFTAGIESLYSEFCVLNNIDFYDTVVQKCNNLEIKKEFLLQGFANKNNVRIESTSINNQSRSLFIPEENYQVRTVKHYPHRELFYSAMRIIWNGDSYVVYGFTGENPYFAYYLPRPTSPVVAIPVGSVSVREKTTYDTTRFETMRYGTSFTSRQELYDVIIGYGKWLEDQGFEFNEPEGGDIRNWQLSAKQFIFWSNDFIQPGSYIDLNPAADEIIVFADSYGQLENLVDNNQNPGWCVDRFGRNLFSKDLLVERDSTITIKSKHADRPVYGIKLTFSMYESVVHLDSTSVFNDVYFSPNQSTTKRSFKLGGKKNYAWDGKYFVYGYMFNGNELIPNYDTFAETGRNLLDIENSVDDVEIVDASRAQFGLNRNPELRQLFLTDDIETQFKNSVTFNKGTASVFTSLEPLTHRDDSSRTIVNEEYMVRIGEFGNTKNIEFYEFQLRHNDINSQDYQLIKFANDGALNPNAKYVPGDDWVYTPYGKNLRFTPDVANLAKLKTSGPILSGDTDYSVTSMEDIPYLYKEFEPLYNIGHYDSDTAYGKDDQFRLNGKLYSVVEDPRTNETIPFSAAAGAITIQLDPALTIPANAIVTGEGIAVDTTGSYNSSTGLLTLSNPLTMSIAADTKLSFVDPAKITKIDEPYLPNIFVEKYDKKNPDLTNTNDPIFAPATWQVIQTIDRELAIEETCAGPSASTSSLARISVTQDHLVEVGDLVLIVNANNGTSSVNGIWPVVELESTSTKQFYIDTRITEVIKTGKVFTFKPIRFRNPAELAAAVNEPEHGYTWNKKFNPQINAVTGTDVLVPPPTTSGYPSALPIAIVDEFEPAETPVTYNLGKYAVYTVTKAGVTTKVKEEQPGIDTSDIEHLLIYDYETNKTLAKVELFDPKNLKIPQIFKDEIDVIGRVDPAKYNNTTDTFKTVYPSQGWYEEFIGRRWWDISSIQFADYNLGNDTEKYNNWGKTVNNRAPDIYEWTKSPVPPNQWSKLVEQKGDAFGVTATGEVYVDNYNGAENYHWVEEQDYVSGNTYTVYYFWVKNKDTIPAESQRARIYSTNVLSKIILNPSAVGLAWWAPISTSAMIIKGARRYLNNISSVIQIKKRLKGNEKNQQWLFVGDGNDIKIIPEWLHTRLKNSLSTVSVYSRNYDFVNFAAGSNYTIGKVVKTTDGKFWRAKQNVSSAADPAVDVSKWEQLVNAKQLTNKEVTAYAYSSVPNENLHPFNRLGNDIRPLQQTWFKDVVAARRTFIQQANKLLKNIDVISSIENWDKHLVNNYEFAELTLDLSEESGVWQRVDFESIDYDADKAINELVNEQKEIFSANLVEGDYIKVLDDGTGNFVIYEKIPDGGFKVVYRENGTVQFSESLITATEAWDMEHLTTSANNKTIATISAVTDIIRNDLFVQSQRYYNQLMCAMLRYVLSEQTNVNWLQKSSTIEPVNLIGQNLNKLAELERDNISTLIDFYGSVKAFRDKIRDSNIIKSRLETAQVEITEINNLNLTLEYSRHDIGVYEFDTVSGIQFVNLGWDDTVSVTQDGWGGVSGVDSWDIDQTVNDSQVEVVYDGSGLEHVLTGSDKSKYYRPGHSPSMLPLTPAGRRGEELVDVTIPEGLTVDVTHTFTGDIDAHVRIHQHQGMMEMFILDSSKLSLTEPVTSETTAIPFADTSLLLDASLDTIQYIWVGKEKIGYTVKTDTGITGLRRAQHGTPLMDHAVTDPVYFNAPATELIPRTPLYNAHLTSPFVNDLEQEGWDSEDWDGAGINFVGTITNLTTEIVLADISDLDRLPTPVARQVEIAPLDIEFTSLDINDLTPILDDNGNITAYEYTVIDPQYVQIGTEIIGYTVKTAAGLGGLIRAQLGTERVNHADTELIYEYDFKGHFVQGWTWDSSIVKALEDSSNGFAAKIKNYFI